VSSHKLQPDVLKLIYSFLAGTLSWQVFKPITWPVVACLIQLHVHYNSHPNPALGTRPLAAPCVTQGLSVVSVVIQWSDGSSFCSIDFLYGHVISLYVPVKTNRYEDYVLILVECIDKL
jgi:hypothetical protein